MANDREYPKETETQATVDPVPEEFDSAIAPQGYEPELVEEIADMETPAQKRRKAIRYIIYSALFFFFLIWLCSPIDGQTPNDIPIPYGLEDRPIPAADLFLRQVPPKMVGDYELIHQDIQRLYEKPFVGAEAAIATYINSENAVATVWVINAGSYINANRYLTGLAEVLREEERASELQDRIWLQTSFVEWYDPDMANRAYGFAWSNEHYYFSITSASEETRDFIAENFPY